MKNQHYSEDGSAGEGSITNALKTILRFFILLTLVWAGSTLFQSCEKDVQQDAMDLDLKASSEKRLKTVELEVIADNMVSPIGMAAAPDETGRLFVIDQIGKVWIVNQSGEKLEAPFLDVTGLIVTLNPGYDERGLLGLAFHPDYAENGRVFAYYTAPPPPGGPEPGAEWNNISRISEFSVSPSDPNHVDLSTEEIILEVNQPQSNHEGGTIAFGPDGYLYISIGDGGGANDVGPGHVEDWYEVNEGGNGQDIEQNLLGNILRIDVDGGMPYAIPPDNPFVGEVGLDEIYAYGFRNPFRFSFDMSGSQRLFVGDAGQNLWEEINVVDKGGNYGWNVKEGAHCFSTEHPSDISAITSCPEIDGYGNKIIDPVIEMRNHDNPLGGETVTIIGGYVYRGNEIPGLQGKYVFGSFSHDFGPTGEIFVSNPAGPGLWSFNEIPLAGGAADIGYYLKGFGQDLNGEMYVTASMELGPSGNSGVLLKMTLADQE